MAEPIVMPFGLWAQNGPRNHELDGGPYPHEKRQILGEWSPIVKYRDFLLWARSHYDVILIGTLFATELATPTITGVRTYVRTYVRTDTLLRLILVHGQVTIIFVVSVGLSVCLSVCAEFFSAVFDPISIKIGHMLYVWV